MALCDLTISQIDENTCFFKILNVKCMKLQANSNNNITTQTATS